MGNYFTRLPYINYGYQAENNRIDTMNLVRINEPKVGPRLSYFNLMDASAVSPSKKLQSECKIDTFIVTRKWKKMTDFYYTPFGTKEISENGSQIAGLSKFPESLCQIEEEDDIFGFKFNRRPPQKDCFKQSQDRPLASCIYQRLDSGFEDTPAKTDTQIDLDSFYITTVIDMVDRQKSCLLKQELICGMNGRCRTSVSFFVDIRDPLKRKPIDDECRFMACSECDSLLSDNESCLDDDFIVFEDCGSEEDSCGFTVSINACIPTELSCSVSANSTINTCVDISLKTSLSPCASTRYKTDFKTLNNVVSVKKTIPPCGCTILKSRKCCTKDPDLNNISTIEVVPSKVETAETFYHTPPKKSCKNVCFQSDESLVTVHPMRHWDFAYREARKGPWEIAAVDRCRFLRRIKDLESIISPCLRRKLEAVQKP